MIKTFEKKNYRGIFHKTETETSHNLEYDGRDLIQIHNKTTQTGSRKQNMTDFIVL